MAAAIGLRSDFNGAALRRLARGSADAGAPAVIILDQAGWRTTAELDVPTNLTLLSLPPRSPELNPVENVWQFIRDNRLSNRVFRSFEEIVDLSAEAWNKLIEQPWAIMSIGRRAWTRGL